MTDGISIIVCYRDREEHLERFVPHIRKAFADVPHEIIIVEQDDDEKFRRGQLLNDGVRYARYDRVALHDVDYLPESLEPYFGDTDVVLPVGKVIFTEDDGQTPLPIDQVPEGYRHFRDGVDDDFYGGVIVFNRDRFIHINGFNTLYQGWGKEDEDLRNRIRIHSLNVQRFPGTFKALPHEDSFPGVHDQHFQYNQQVYSQWQKLTQIGYRTTHSNRVENKEKAEKWGVDTWVEAKNWIVVPSYDFEDVLTLDKVRLYYEDNEEHHEFIWKSFKQMVNQHELLKAHRDFVVNYRWGYGNRAFHWMWNLLIHDAPDNFKMLEIGVYMGQTISLASMLNKLYKKNGTIYGITPLDKSGDKYATHPDINYEEAIQRIYAQFGLDASDLMLIEGYSDNEEIIEIVDGEGPYDLLYVDGCHDYEVVVNDLTKYGDMVRVGGWLVVDDASNDLAIPDGLIRMDWRGLPDVTKAVNDVIIDDERWEEWFAVGHNRVFKKVSK